MPFMARVCAVLACALLVALAGHGRALAQPFAAAIMDVRTGEFLWQTDNANTRVHPASLTKMMTLYIAFEAIENGEISLDTRVRISQHAASQPPSRLGLRAGQTIAFRYLIRAAALRSANDAAAAIGEAIEGSTSAFATRMNRTAAAIGMTRTRFRNAHGLTADGHMSSARDMSLLGRQLYFDFPQYYGLFSRRSENAGIATVTNTNSRFLDSYPGADGIKTGYTRAAGYSLTAMAERDGVRLIVTVMGARSGADRLRRVTELMDRGFRLAPRRATTREPGRPDYVRAPEDRGSGPAAGRVIRLQPAPTQSIFPRPRPDPGQAPSEETIAALRSTIDEALEDIREPDTLQDSADVATADGETTEEPAETAGEPLPAAPDEAVTEVAALARSPVPRLRPVALVQSTATEIPAEAPPEAAIESVEAQPDGAATGASVVETPVETADASVTGEAPAATAAAVDTGAAEIEVAGLPAEPPDDSLAVDHPADQPVAQTTVAAAPPPPVLPEIAPVPADLSVDDDGRVLWRDEELLAALAEEDPSDPVLSPVIVLTTASTETAPADAPMPEIVSRSTSGGRLWRVELGLHPSRFDAERALLSHALSESGTLGSGVRAVVPRDGRFLAEVNSLDQAQAELACARLQARGHDCVAVAP